MSDDRKKAQGKIWWLWFGFAVTCAYAVLVVGFISQYETGFIDRIAKMELNSIGDFLAGVFAPLAFLWLFVATMMQSTELRLQREELELTRNEMRESRGVMSDQAQAAKDQAVTAGLQAQAAREQINLQREIAEATYKVSLLDVRVKIFGEIREGMNRLRDMTASEVDSYASAVSRGQLVFGAEIAQEIDELIKLLVSVMIDIQMLEQNHGVHAFKHYQERLDSDNWLGSPVDDDRLEEFKEELIDLIERCDAVRDRIIENDLLKKMRAVMTINVSTSKANEQNQAVLDID